VHKSTAWGGRAAYRAHDRLFFQFQAGPAPRERSARRPERGSAEAKD